MRKSSFMKGMNKLRSRGLSKSQAFNKMSGLARRGNGMLKSSKVVNSINSKKFSSKNRTYTVVDKKTGNPVSHGESYSSAKSNIEYSDNPSRYEMVDDKTYFSSTH